MDSVPINVSCITAYDADYISQYLMRSRNPDMSIEEPLRRYRAEQNAKPLRKAQNYTDNNATERSLGLTR